MSTPSARPQNEGQLATDLPSVTTYLTGHDTSGKAIVQETRPKWASYGDKKIGFNVVYATDQFPASLSNDTDIATSDAIVSSGKLGLVSPNGTVCRMVDFAPGYSANMHRTQSLDYGIVLEGEIEMVLDDGSVTKMTRGDVAVQRATMHAWRNPNPTQWCRMIFVLQDCQPLEVGGQKLGEDLGTGAAWYPKSGND